jgi:hypothetical protein
LSRVKATGEVFTPRPLVLKMLQRIPPEIWLDPAKTFLDNSAGDGNFLLAAKDVLMRTLKREFPDPVERERHILEEQLFAVEIMPDNVMRMQERLGYLVRAASGELVPNPILDPDHFRRDPIAHELPSDSFDMSDLVRAGKIVGFGGDMTAEQEKQALEEAPWDWMYLHHRNIVCADALKYDYTFGRAP